MADLSRFVDAQAGSYADALAELRRGAKRGHWMWWIFPQIAGLGMSDTSRRYAIRSLDEARTYLRHPVLGPRLLEATAAVTAADGSAEAILGGVDAVKLRSSMTLFALAAEAEGMDAGPFQAALDRFHGGARDPETVKRV